ncbi:MAG: class I SAM-dependent methyltransferase [Anaerolineae bacterium]|nr:class I SAM-dependent methyltransferase [Anaerolineae bacterium]
MSNAPHLATPDTSYDPSFFSLLFEIEDRHFWFRTRNHIIRQLVQQITRDLPANYRVLEVGCGTGNVLRHLEQVCAENSIMGMDLFWDGLHYAQQRVTCPLIQGDMHNPPFGVRFDLIGMFDVLEHLSDDIQVLADLHRMLALGGRLILTVPAHASLWSYFDEASHHYRRYPKSDLQQKLNAVGYEIEFISYYMMSIFPLVWLGRRMASLLNGKKEQRVADVNEMAARELKITPGVNGFLTAWLMQESRLISNRKQLPIGTSLLAIARKKS